MLPMIGVACAFLFSIWPYPGIGRLIRLLLIFLLSASLSVWSAHPLYSYLGIFLIVLNARPKVETTVSVWRVVVFAASQLLLIASFLASYSRRPFVMAIVDGGLKTLKPIGLNMEDETQPPFRMLTRLLDEYGCEGKVLKENFGGTDLQGIDGLVVINPSHAFTKDQIQAVRVFVEGGKGPLVLGDHTNIGGIRDPVNQLLSFTDITLNFDSALPTDASYHWKSALLTRPFSPLSGLTNESLCISVGASLSCKGTATPLVVAEHGFSDKGNPFYKIATLAGSGVRRLLKLSFICPELAIYPLPAPCERSTLLREIPSRCRRCCVASRRRNGNATTTRWRRLVRGSSGTFRRRGRVRLPSLKPSVLSHRGSRSTAPTVPGA